MHQHLLKINSEHKGLPYLDLVIAYSNPRHCTQAHYISWGEGESIYLDSDQFPRVQHEQHLLPSQDCDWQFSARGSQ